jgi:hypothetical protein
MIQAKVIADSLSTAGVRITTLELQYPRFIHGEVMTHRVFSRNAMSSRAIPVAKMVQQVLSDPAMPIHWGKNQPGMQAAEEHDAPVTVPGVLRNAFGAFNGYHNPDHAPEQTDKVTWWRFLGWVGALGATAYADAGYHKQIVNRRLEADQWMRTLVTSTEWTNFFELRAHPDAQPEFHELALQMQGAMGSSEPVLMASSNDVGSWHLPYILDSERALYRPDILVKLSTARCARVSYLTHDGETPDVQKDLALFERLVGSRPLHASPAEHQARASSFGHHRSRNFTGWTQHRQLLEEKLPC